MLFSLTLLHFLGAVIALLFSLSFPTNNPLFSLSIAFPLLISLFLFRSLIFFFLSFLPCLFTSLFLSFFDSLSLLLISPFSLPLMFFSLKCFSSVSSPFTLPLSGLVYLIFFGILEKALSGEARGFVPLTSKAARSTLRQS